ncbi:hypothetical protein WJX73_006471 [Symbiochloris irregularis]|uniref:J domain-containing protein n=1 Tax=Symbiochloris irregularis TaxID=706552 RepID=A0AAW1NRZ8_9CHLO
MMPLRNPKHAPAAAAHLSRSAGVRHQGTKRSLSAQRSPAAQRAAPLNLEIEQLREKGNAAFKAGSYSIALQHYQEAQGKALTCRPVDDDLQARILSNCAAAQLHLGQPQAALQSCKRALQAVPNHTRALGRAVTCHLRMGGFSAAQGFIDALRAQPLTQAEANTCQQSKDALQALVQQALARAAKAATAEEGVQALAALEACLEDSHAPCMPSLLLTKADLLLLLDRHQDATRMVLAASEAAGWPQERLERYSKWVHAHMLYSQGQLDKAATAVSEMAEAAADDECRPAPALLPSRSAFAMLQQAEPQAFRDLAQSLTMLHQAKEEGNNAWRRQDKAAALNFYTHALEGITAPPPVFAAVVFASRAAVHRADGRLLDALADSLRSLALCPLYMRGVLRLGQLLTDMGRHELAAQELGALQKEQAAAARAHAVNATCIDLWRDVDAALKKAKEGQRQRRAIDHFEVLGVPRTLCTDDEVKKAYRQLVLKFHPDKALGRCRFSSAIHTTCRPSLAQSQLEERVRAQAHRVFSMISDASTALATRSSRITLEAQLNVAQYRTASQQQPYSPGRYSGAYQPRSSTARASRQNAYSKTYSNDYYDSDYYAYERFWAS